MIKPNDQNPALLAEQVRAAMQASGASIGALGESLRDCHNAKELRKAASTALSILAVLDVTIANTKETIVHLAAKLGAAEGVDSL